MTWERQQTYAREEGIAIGKQENAIETTKKLSKNEDWKHWTDFPRNRTTNWWSKTFGRRNRKLKKNFKRNTER